MSKKVITLGLLLLPFISQAAEGSRHSPSPVHPGSFYSMQRNTPPLPFSPFLDLPIYEIEKGQFLYDDREVDYEALSAQAYAKETAEPNAGQALMQFGGSDPALTISRNGQGQIEVQIVNAPVGKVFDLYQTSKLEGNSATAGHWQKVGSGSDGHIFTFSGQSSSPVFYLLGDQDTDQDLDGLADAYEVLETKTSTAVPNSRRGVYETAIGGPSGWFKLNDSSLANAVPGRQPLVVGGTGGGFDNDVFATGNGAYSFAKPPPSFADPRLTLTETDDALGGGTGEPTDRQGSFTLLFRALNGQPVSARYLLSQGTDIGTTTGDALAVYVDGAGLKVRVGPVERTILADVNLARGAWYYLAVTCDETRANNEVSWYLARVGSDTLQSGSLTLGQKKKFGNNGVITVGTQEGSTTGGYYWDVAGVSPSPRNGYLDQIAFWNRELLAGEITAQFNALPQSDLANHFDLSRWNLELPVTKLNALDPNDNDPLKISTGWLNNDFEYVDPVSSHANPNTKKYFYLSTDKRLVFQVPYNGARSESWPRSELRATKTDGSEDNWLPDADGGTHTLTGTCRIMDHKVGKLIIGQIHAKTSPAKPAITLYIDYDPTHLYTKVAVYNTPASSSPVHSPVVPALNDPALNTDIKYELALVGTRSPDSVTLHVKIWFNGETTPRIVNVSMDTSWLNNQLYFKAGCYYNNTSTDDAKVTFSSLLVTP